MAKEKFNVSVPIKYGEDNERTFWHNIGTAFKNDKGQMTVYLNSLPLPNSEGKCSFMIFPPKEDDADRDYGGQRGGGRSKPTAGKRSAPKSDIDDEIPF